MSRRGRTYAERRIAEGMVRDGALGWAMKTEQCEYPTCTTNGRCPITACHGDHRCRVRADPDPAVQCELDARLPLGDRVVEL